MSISSKDSQNDLDNDDLRYIKERTNLSFQRILDFYRTFLSKYNSGYVNRQQFIDIINKLFIDKNDKNERVQNSNEKLAICERLFDICDHDDDGSIDFKEYLILFWSKVNGELTFTLIFLNFSKEKLFLSTILRLKSNLFVLKVIDLFIYFHIYLIFAFSFFMKFHVLNFLNKNLERVLFQMCT